MSLLPAKFTHDGFTICTLGPGAILRSDGQIGFVSRWATPADLSKPDGVYWYTREQVANRAGISVSQLNARVRARWAWADLIKGDGWERVVDARRNGVEQPNGTRVPYDEFCAKLNLGKQALANRLMRGYAWEHLSLPGVPRAAKRVLIEVPPPNITTAPAVGKGLPPALQRFYYRGALDTLSGHAKAAGLEPQTVRARMRRGCSLDQALQPGRKPRQDRGRPNNKRGNRPWAIPPRADGTPDTDRHIDYTEMTAEQFAASKAAAKARPAATPEDTRTLEEILGLDVTQMLTN